MRRDSLIVKINCKICNKEIDTAISGFHDSAYKCKHCNEYFCGRHINQMNHDCKAIDKKIMKKEKASYREKKLSYKEKEKNFMKGAIVGIICSVVTMVISASLFPEYNILTLVRVSITTGVAAFGITLSYLIWLKEK